MEIREYNYKLRRYKKDGTEVFYDCYIQYKPRCHKEDIPVESIELIKKKVASGITKKRICSDHNISFNKLQQILKT